MHGIDDTCQELGQRICPNRFAQNLTGVAPGRPQRLMGCPCMWLRRSFGLDLGRCPRPGFFEVSCNDAFKPLRRMRLLRHDQLDGFGREFDEYILSGAHWYSLPFRKVRRCSEGREV